LGDVKEESENADTGTLGGAKSPRIGRTQTQSDLMVLFLNLIAALRELDGVFKGEQQTQMQRILL
jgi:hypothetical protein